MKRLLGAVLVALVVLVGMGASAAYADGGYVVQAGDTLASISRHHGVSIQQLARANGLNWNDWVFIGQRLVIPGLSQATPATSQGMYMVQAGDTLFGIALKYGVSMTALQSANGLTNADVIYRGQRLVIPGQGSGPTIVAPATTAYAPDSGAEKWIDVNLSNQTITAYEGQTPVMQAVVSTGTWRTPTVVGTFKIQSKYPLTRMFGGSGADYYDLWNVPHVMYFYKGYGFHGTYWHNNFGTPMSHGCVNLSLTDAAWLYEWASVGTKVVSHY